METIRGNWYDHPHLYDIAFGYDPAAEVKMHALAAGDIDVGFDRDRYTM